VRADPVWLVVGPAGGHRQVVGGLSVIERRVRELAARGVRHVIVAAEPEPLPALAPDVEFAPGATPPDSARVERGDEVAGIVVVDDRTRADAEWALLRRMNKSFEGPVDALVNCKISMRITRVLARTPLTPNHVTLFAMVLGLVACGFVQGGRYWPAAIAGVLMELNSILDSCDGELARLRYQFSKLGQWLDNVSDDIVDNLFIVCAGFGAGGTWVWLGIAAALSRALVAAGTYMIVYKKTGTGDVFAFRYWFEQDKETADEVYELTSVAAWIRSFGRRDTYVFGWMLVCLAGLGYGVVVWGGIIALINVPMFVAHLVATTAAGANARAATADLNETIGRD
jgi:phosphatidylglycerophosphate synthase